MQIKLKKLNREAKIPTRGSADAAGYDLYACMNEENHPFILSRCNKKIPTGIALEIPHGYFGAVFARSGMAVKQGLRPANCVAVIDSDYRGELMVPLYNDSDAPQRIEHGQRIAQLIILPCLDIEFSEVSELSDTQRGIGGFGSTG